MKDKVMKDTRLDDGSNTDKTRNQASRHRLLKLKFRTPARTMTSQQNFHTKRFQVSNCGPDLVHITINKVVAAYHRIEWNTGAESDGVFSGVYDTCVGTTGEEHQAFVCRYCKYEMQGRGRTKRGAGRRIDGGRRTINAALVRMSKVPHGNQKGDTDL